MKLAPFVALFGAAVLLYSAILVQPPTRLDELLLYSSLWSASHPFGYFLHAADLSLPVYRPLHLFVEWIVFRVFGVWVLPSQLFNLLLHAVAVALLVDLMRRVCPPRNRLLLPLLAASALASPYTAPTALWISDRPTLFVAIFVLLLVRHLGFSGNVRPGVVAALSATALFSKESGVLVPLVAAVYGWRRQRRDVIVVSGAIVAGYFALRFTVLGDNTFAYAESGMLLGRWYYDSSAELTMRQYLAMLPDNIIKHIVAVGLPVFDEEGGLLGGRLLLRPLVIATTGLLIVTAGRLSRVQMAALLVIAANAVIHVAVFRHRMLYVSHFALLVFVASSTALASDRRRVAAMVLAAMLVVAGVVGGARLALGEVEESYQLLHSDELAQFAEERDDAAAAVVDDIRRLYDR